MKGLKFTPTPSSNVTELKADIQEFNRKLRLAEYFESETTVNNAETGAETSSETDSDDTASLVKNKSGFKPPHNRDKILESFIDYINSQPLSSQKTRNNLTIEERKALKSLSSDSSIVIKEADKGGSVVIMDTDYYVSKVQSMLNDQESYQEVNAARDSLARTNLNNFVWKYEDNEEITEKEADFLLNFNVKQSLFYGLPKVHKSQIVMNAIREQKSEFVEINSPNDLRFRPIVGGPQCVTHRLSNYLDILLKPLAVRISSYLRDTMDFLSKLPDEVETESVLVSYDVSSLYSVIPHGLGLQAVSFWFDKYKDCLPKQVSKELILEGLSVVLENNTFKFGDKWFLQKKGTAMGTKVAPTYATLVLGYLEEQFYVKVSEEFNSDIATYVKECWSRFLDDCFMIWPLRFGDVGRMTAILNGLHPDFKFIIAADPVQIPFLDVMVTIEGKKVTTDIYHKDTDSRRYLPYDSCHPGHTRRNIPYSLARRVAMIVKKHDRRKFRMDELRCDLLRCGYPKRLVNDAIHKFSGVQSESLRISKKKRHEKVLTFVHTHNPGNPNMFKTIQQSLPIMQSSPQMRKILSKTKVINSSRQPKNLKRILTKSALHTQSNLTGVKKCGRKNCGTCDMIIEGISYHFRQANINFTVKHDMNCRTSSVIYCIECSHCKEIYIGQTGGPLQKRMTVHRQHVRDIRYRILPVSKHIAECAAGIDPPFKVFPFYKTIDMTDIERESKEQFFISKLKPKLNSV